MPDPISAVGLVFGAPSFVQSVGELTGLVESTNAKLDKLIGAEFETGMDLIRQAQISSNRQAPLLEQAVPHLTKSTKLETGYMRAMSLLALAFCHHHLGDLANSRKSLWDIRKIQVPKNKIKIAMAKDAALAVTDYVLPSIPFLFRRISGVKPGYAIEVEIEIALLQELIDDIEAYFESKLLDTK